jgi:deoxyribodipyrimidine photo-lyase
MVESLTELQKKIKKKNGELYFFYGKQNDVIKKILKDNSIDAVYFNKDWTPYALKRDESINKICKKNNIDCIQTEDYTLLPINKLLNQNGEVYKVYGAFYRNAKKFKVSKPKKIKNYNFSKLKKVNNIELSYIDKFYKKNEDILVKGGRKKALKILKRIKSFHEYSTRRNEVLILNLDVYL